MRIYLDVCCLNRPFDDQTQERIRLESEAVLLILERCQSGEWELIGSEAVDYEILRIPDMERRRKVFCPASMACTKKTVDEAVRARAEELGRFGFRALDALHIACVEMSLADVLLTTDDRMLAKAREFGKSLHVRVENPIIWLMEVASGGNPENDPCSD